jgi:hypothetical protein
LFEALCLFLALVVLCGPGLGRSVEVGEIPHVSGIIRGIDGDFVGWGRHGGEWKKYGGKT